MSSRAEQGENPLLKPPESRRGFLRNDSAIPILVVSLSLTAFGAYGVYSLRWRSAAEKALNARLDRVESLLLAGVEENRRLSVMLGESLDSSVATLAESVASSETKTQTRLRGVEARVSGKVQDLAVRFSSADERTMGTLGTVRGQVEDVSDRVISVDDKMAAITDGKPGSANFGFSVSPLDLPVERALKSGRTAFSAGLYSDAYTHFAEASRLNPEHKAARLYSLISRFYANPAESISFSSLERSLTLALQDDPHDAVALRAFGRLSMERGAWNAALGYFDRLDAIGRADKVSLEEAGVAAAYTGDAEKSAYYAAKAAAAGRE